MYSSGAMVLLDGLQEGASSVLSRIETGPFFAYQGGAGDLKAFPAPSGLQGDLASGRIRDAILRVDGEATPVRVFSLSNPSLIQVTAPASGTVLLHPSKMVELGLAVGENMEIEGEVDPMSLGLAGPLRGVVGLPEEWILLGEEDLLTLFPGAVGLHDFLILEKRHDAEALEAEGFTILPLTSAGDFFLQGLEEARRVVLALVTASSVAIAVITFSLISLEVRYRQREIATLRALGMGEGTFSMLYGLQLAFIVASGSVLGMALGIVVANGLVSFAPFFGLTTIIRPQVTSLGLVLPLISSFTAGILGGGASLLSTLRRFARET